ncbi:miraculin-like [Arachis stenosperma]|uniref:miraculin-like n=1 Tax=Arachis stenosperma TaxID=217475 RepID=UPI0025AD7A92|nr:miraculin-like [Arachis stenosperma]
MKTSCMSVVLILLTPLILSWDGDSASEPVLDITGKNLRTGIDYLVLPSINNNSNGGGGVGLALASARNRTCPFDVVDSYRAMPLKFAPSDSKDGVIRVSTDLNIKFSAATTCVQSTVWKLDQFDGSRGLYFVTTGGVEGNPGRETVSNWFEIQKYGSNYKLLFCPKVCKYCKVMCRDLGIFVDGDGNRHLALSDMPFGVRFRKA